MIRRPRHGRNQKWIEPRNLTALLGDTLETFGATSDPSAKVGASRGRAAGTVVIFHPFLLKPLLLLSHISTLNQNKSDTMSVITKIHARQVSDRAPSLDPLEAWEPSSRASALLSLRYTWSMLTCPDLRLSR